jgi:hypothetical protein
MTREENAKVLLETFWNRDHKAPEQQAREQEKQSVTKGGALESRLARKRTKPGRVETTIESFAPKGCKQVSNGSEP